MTRRLRDSRGRFTSEMTSQTNWPVLAVVTIFVIAVAAWCYLIPTWVQGVQKESYDTGYAAGNAAGFTDGLQMGDEYCGWNWTTSFYGGALVCNSTVCRRIAPSAGVLIHDITPGGKCGS